MQVLFVHLFCVFIYILPQTEYIQELANPCGTVNLLECPCVWFQLPSLSSLWVCHDMFVALAVRLWVVVCCCVEIGVWSMHVTWLNWSYCFFPPSNCKMVHQFSSSSSILTYFPKLTEYRNPCANINTANSSNSLHAIFFGVADCKQCYYFSVQSQQVCGKWRWRLSADAASIYDKCILVFILHSPVLCRLWILCCFRSSLSIHFW